MNRKSFFVVTALILLMIAFAVEETKCQTPVPTPKLICITQGDANQCAADHREAAALREEVTTLKTQLETERQGSKTDAANYQKSIEELKAQNTKLIGDVGNLTGQITATQAELTNTRARLDQFMQFLLTNGRKKCGVLTLLCIQ